MGTVYQYMFLIGRQDWNNTIAPGNRVLAFTTKSIKNLFRWRTPRTLYLISFVPRLKMIFCDTAGMPHNQAKRFFSQNSIIQKARNPWLYKGKINRLMKKIGVPQIFDVFRQFEADQYGGNRQWLRCIAQKTVLKLH